MSREPSPLVWLAIKVDDIGHVVYAVIITLELLILWMQYS